MQPEAEPANPAEEVKDAHRGETTSSTRRRVFPQAGSTPARTLGRTAIIHVIAIITAKPGQRDEILDAFRANMPAVHAEQGCLEYAPAIDAEGAGQDRFGPDSFVVIEKWASLDALKAHAASPHMAAYGRATADLLATRAVHVLTPA